MLPRHPITLIAHPSSVVMEPKQVITSSASVSRRRLRGRGGLGAHCRWRRGRVIRRAWRTTSSCMCTRPRPTTRGSVRTRASTLPGLDVLCKIGSRQRQRLTSADLSVAAEEYDWLRLYFDEVIWPEAQWCKRTRDMPQSAPPMCTPSTATNLPPTSSWQPGV